MNNIEKFLKKLNRKEYVAILLILEQMKIDFHKVPGIIKLTGHQNLYRVRIGRYRIIFQISPNQFEIIRITKRDEQTYKNL